MPQTAPGTPQPQQPPPGVSQATGPTPNKGYEAAAAQRLGLVVQQLDEIVKLTGASSEIGQTVFEVLKKLLKYVPAGSVSPAAAKNNIEQMAMRNAQQGQQMQALKAQQGQQQQPAQQMPPQMAKAA